MTLPQRLLDLKAKLDRPNPYQGWDGLERGWEIDLLYSRQVFVWLFRNDLGEVTEVYLLFPHLVNIHTKIDPKTEMHVPMNYTHGGAIIPPRDMIHVKSE